MSRCRATGRASEPFDHAQGSALSGVERAERGFSLLELMIVMTLLAMFVGALYETVLVGVRHVGSADTREELRTKLTRALDQFTREVRMARNVDFARETRFQFDADFNADGDSGDAGEANINYQVTGTALTRSQGAGAAMTLVPILSSTADLFDYYALNATTESDTCDSSAGCASATCTPAGCQCRCEVRVVEVNVSATDSSASPTETVTISSSAFLGNR